MHSKQGLLTDRKLKDESDEDEYELSDDDFQDDTKLLESVSNNQPLTTFEKLKLKYINENKGDKIAILDGGAGSFEETIDMNESIKRSVSQPHFLKGYAYDSS